MYTRCEYRSSFRAPRRNRKWHCIGDQTHTFTRRADAVLTSMVGKVENKSQNHNGDSESIFDRCSTAVPRAHELGELGTGLTTRDTQVRARSDSKRANLGHDKITCT